MMLLRLEKSVTQMSPFLNKVYRSHQHVYELSDLLFGVLLLEQEGSAVSTVVVRGSTDNIMDDTERAIDDGINTFRTVAKVMNVC